MKILISILSLLPLRALYAVADGLLYPLMYYIVRYRRALSYRNIRASFPNKSEEEIINIQKGFYHHLSDVIVEIIHSYRATDDQMRQLISFTHADELERLAAQTHGVIIMLGHMGNWEYTADIQKRFTGPNMRHFNVYRRLKNHSADSLMLSIRDKRSGEGSCLEKHSLLRQMIVLNKQDFPFTIGLISDQKPSPGNDYLWTDFLNHDTGFLGGGEILAHKFGYAVVFADVRCPRRGHYDVDVKVITENPKETQPYDITRQFVSLLEQNIQAQPEQWLWTHNRWKWKRSESKKS